MIVKFACMCIVKEAPPVTLRWGMEGQRRLRNSRVLLIGMGALNSEVCKNLVLGGVGKVTLMDDAIVATEDLRSQIFVRQAGIGKQRSEACIELVKDLNPLVQVEIAAGNIMHLPTSFYEQFDIISMTGVDLATILHVDEVCRQCVGIKLYCTDIHGMCGWVFNDLGQSHEFTVEREVTDEKDTTKKIKEASIVTEAWPSMPDALSNTSAWVGKKQKQVQRNVSPVYFLFRCEPKLYEICLILISDNAVSARTWKNALQDWPAD